MRENGSNEIEERRLCPNCGRMNIAGHEVCYMCGESMDKLPVAVRTAVSRDDSETTKLYAPSGWRITPLSGGRTRVEQVGLSRFLSICNGIAYYAVLGVIACTITLTRLGGMPPLPTEMLSLGWIALAINVSVVLFNVLWYALGKDELIVAPGYIAVIRELGPYRRHEVIEAKDAVLSVDLSTYYSRTGKQYRAKLFAVHENQRIFLTQQTGSQSASMLQIAPCISIVTGWPVLNG